MIWSSNFIIVGLCLRIMVGCCSILGLGLGFKGFSIWNEGCGHRICFWSGVEYFELSFITSMLLGIYTLSWIVVLRSWHFLFASLVAFKFSRWFHSKRYLYLFWSILSESFFSSFFFLFFNRINHFNRWFFLLLFISKPCFLA